MKNIQSILTPVDFSDNAGKIAQAAAYVAGTFKAELHLVFVVLATLSRTGHKG